MNKQHIAANIHQSKSEIHLLSLKSYILAIIINRLLFFIDVIVCSTLQQQVVVVGLGC
jgi:hypothetical protein